MAAFQPIEDAGPRLVFGADDFLRVFVTAASPGVVAGNHQGPRRAMDSSSLFKRTHRQGWKNDFKRPLRKTKRVPGNLIFERI